MKILLLRLFKYYDPFSVLTVLYCTVLYCTVLYCTVLYCTILYCTVLYCIVLYCTVLYCTVLYCTVLYCTIKYCTVMYCTRTVLFLCTKFCCNQPENVTPHPHQDWIGRKIMCIVLNFKTLHNLIWNKPFRIPPADLRAWYLFKKHI